MDARKFLSRAFELSRELGLKERQLNRFRGVVPYGSPEYGDVRIGTDRKHSAVEHTAIRFALLSEEVRAMAEELTSVMKETEAAIARVQDSDAEAVLEMRYLSFMGWEEIAGSLGVSVRHVFRLHRIGLEEVGRHV